MLSLDKIRAVRTVISHDRCADGYASAILIRDAFYGRTDVEFRFLQYGTEELRTLRAEPNMLFVDFSPPADRVQEFVEAGALVLDHHKKAKAVVEAFGEDGVFADERLDSGVSGALLAYHHVWYPLRSNMVIQQPFALKFATLTGIRDTWQRNHVSWVEACKQAHTLSFYPREKWMEMSFSQLAAQWNSQFGWLGDLLYEKQMATTQKAIEKSSRFVTPAGTRVMVFEGVRATSDVAEEVGDEMDLIVGFNYEVEGSNHKFIVSTRSHKDYDCGALCVHFGGGGHTKAAGFSTVFDPEAVLTPASFNPYLAVKLLVMAYESSKGD